MGSRVARVRWTAAAVGLALVAMAAEGAQAVSDEQEIALRLGGAGGVYFLASPGDLVVEVQKRDLNRTGRPTHLRAILFGPDRRVLDEQWIADDGLPRRGGLGPAKRVRLSTRVERKGVYGLNVTVTTDRYGRYALWGFRTNCPLYLIETSRGHKDEPHQEPIVVANRDVAGDVCFLPRRGEFSLEVSGLDKRCGALTLHNAKGELLATLQAGKARRVAYRAPANVHRDAVPWRLHFPRFQGTVQADALTRWAQDDCWRDMCLWTPDARSWFAFHENRWLLTPYSRIVYGRPDEEGTLTFSIHNNALRQRTIDLSVESAGGGTLALSHTQVTVGPRNSTEVDVRYRVPAQGAASTCYVRATPQDQPDFSTYSTIVFKSGRAPAAGPLAIPIVLKPYAHENAQFGYLPDYPVGNQMYFSPANRPFVALRDGLATWRDGHWTTVDLARAVRGSGDAPVRPRTSKVAFDKDGDVYLLASMGGRPVLLHSSSGGADFAAYPVPGGGGFDIEQFSGHNVPKGPPPFVRFRRTAKDPKLRWRSLNDLELFVPEKTADGLVVGDPILLSRLCIGQSAHSGIPSSIVSRGDKIHVVWGEATDPKKKVPGVPTFVATYDRASKQLGKPVLIGYGPPPNDVHNSPCITMDGKGTLHVLVGTHGRPFQYARSLKPNDAYGGWTKTEQVGAGLSQTYVGLVCDSTDTLHLVFRLWRGGRKCFPAGSYATLAHMSKSPGKPWSPPRVLLVAPFSEYSIYYHRLTIDPRGRLFLSYDYWSTFWFYRVDRRETRRALLLSPDGGATWQLAATSDLVR